jgi:hypothetical protein
MEADLDAAAALKALEGLAEQILQSSEADASVEKAREALREMAGVLGLRLGLPPEPRVTQGWDQHLARFATP